MREKLAVENFEMPEQHANQQPEEEKLGKKVSPVVSREEHAGGDDADQNYKSATNDAKSNEVKSQINTSNDNRKLS